MKKIFTRNGLVKRYDNGGKIAVYTIDAYKGLPKPIPMLLVYGLDNFSITRKEAAKRIREIRNKN